MLERPPINEDILSLSNDLSEGIIQHNLEEQLSKKILVEINPINYIDLYMDRYHRLTIDEKVNDDRFIIDTIESIFKFIEEKMKEKFLIDVGKDVEDYIFDEYIEDISNLYEFFFIRYYSNLIDFIFHRLIEHKNVFKKHYKGLQKTEAETYNMTDDLLYKADYKSFKQPDDAILFFYLDEIIESIRDADIDILDFIRKIIELDPDESVNSYIEELIITNYGDGVSFDGTKDAYKALMKVLYNRDIFTNISSAVREKLRKYVEFKNLGEK